MKESLWGGQVEKVESALRNEGAIMVEGAPGRIGGTTLHRELVTGCNPLASSALGEEFLRMITTPDRQRK